jgi:hypothetical protein
MPAVGKDLSERWMFGCLPFRQELNLGMMAPSAGRDSERLSAEDLSGSEAMPGISALPVSARDGETILKAMGGDVAPPKWQGGEGATTKLE